MQALDGDLEKALTLIRAALDRCDDEWIPRTMIADALVSEAVNRIVAVNGHRRAAVIFGKLAELIREEGQRLERPLN